MLHTQGEWKVRSGFKVTCGEEQVWVADCYPFHEKHPRPKMIEAEANAHLIASAPAMHEALCSALGSLTVFNTPKHFWVKEIITHIKQVLATAEGK